MIGRDEGRVGEDCADRVDGTFNASLEAGTKVVVATGRDGLGANSLQQAFRPEAAVNLANANTTGARLFVQGYEPVGHHCSVGRPWRVRIGQPIGPSGHFQAK